jgi:hypothetical protein
MLLRFAVFRSLYGMSDVHRIPCFNFGSKLNSDGDNPLGL